MKKKYVSKLLKKKSKEDKLKWVKDQMFKMDELNEYIRFTNTKYHIKYSDTIEIFPNKLLRTIIDANCKMTTVSHNLMLFELGIHFGTKVGNIPNNFYTELYNFIYECCITESENRVPNEYKSIFDYIKDVRIFSEAIIYAFINSQALYFKFPTTTRKSIRDTSFTISIDRIVEYGEDCIYIMYGGLPLKINTEHDVDIDAYKKSTLIKFIREYDAEIDNFKYYIKPGRYAYTRVTNSTNFIENSKVIECYTDQATGIRVEKHECVEF